MIKKFTFSYLLFSEKEDKKYEYISGDFISSSNSLYFFDALQHDGMLLLGMTGLKYEGDSPFSLDVTQGNDEIKNQLFYHSFVQTTQN